MNETKQDTEYRFRELQAAFDRRIGAVEKRARHRGAILAAAFLASVGAFWLSTFSLRQIENVHLLGETASSLETQAVVLRDADGIERGSLRVGPDGAVTLSLRDERANTRLRLSVLEDGSPGVTLLDSDGNTRAVLGLLPDGTTTLVFADAGSVARTVLAVTPDGASRIVFSDNVGDARAALGVDGEGRPEMSTSSDRPR
jgi:hypothetical protein